MNRRNFIRNLLGGIGGIAGAVIVLPKLKTKKPDELKLADVVEWSKSLPGYYKYEDKWIKHELKSDNTIKWINPTDNTCEMYLRHDKSIGFRGSLWCRCQNF